MHTQVLIDVFVFLFSFFIYQILTGQAVGSLTREQKERLMAESIEKKFDFPQMMAAAQAIAGGILSKRKIEYLQRLAKQRRQQQRIASAVSRQRDLGADEELLEAVQFQPGDSASTVLLTNLRALRVEDSTFRFAGGFGAPLLDADDLEATLSAEQVSAHGAYPLSTQRLYAMLSRGVVVQGNSTRFFTSEDFASSISSSASRMILPNTSNSTTSTTCSSSTSSSSSSSSALPSSDTPPTTTPNVVLNPDSHVYEITADALLGSQVCPRFFPQDFKVRITSTLLAALATANSSFLQLSACSQTERLKAMRLGILRHTAAAEFMSRGILPAQRELESWQQLHAYLTDIKSNLAWSHRRSRGWLVWAVVSMVQPLILPCVTPSFRSVTS